MGSQGKHLSSVSTEVPAGHCALQMESETSSLNPSLHVVHTVGKPVQVLQFVEQLTQLVSWTTVTFAGHEVRHLYM